MITSLFHWFMKQAKQALLPEKRILSWQVLTCCNASKNIEISNRRSISQSVERGAAAAWLALANLLLVWAEVAPASSTLCDPVRCGLTKASLLRQGTQSRPVPQRLIVKDIWFLDRKQFASNQHLPTKPNATPTKCPKAFLTDSCSQKTALQSLWTNLNASHFKISRSHVRNPSEAQPLRFFENFGASFAASSATMCKGGSWTSGRPKKMTIGMGVYIYMYIPIHTIWVFVNTNLCERIYTRIYIYMYKQDGHVYTCNVSSRYCSIMQTQTQYINYNYTQYILSNHLISSHVITSAYIHLSMCNIENERAARRWHAFILILWCVG